MVHPPMAQAPHHPALLQRRLRKRQVMALPIIFIVIGALVVAVMLLAGILQTQETDPLIAMVAIFLSAVTAIVGTLLLVWLDRWEPEPPHLLVAAFFWGGGISLILVFTISPVLAIFGGDGDFFGAVISAPLVEESAKALFMIIVLLTSSRGRGEFTSLTDALVYAGFIGIGFSFIEDLLYIASTETVGDAVTLAGIRLGLGAFNHSIYTAMTAIGIWKGLQSSGVLRFVWPFAGWCVAVLLHAIHNGSTFLGYGAYFLGLLIITLPAFIGIVVLAVWSKKKEGKVVQQQMPALVHHGWITPEEASWLVSLKSRRARLAAVNAGAGTAQERKRLKEFSNVATELCFTRDRLDRQTPAYHPNLLRQHDELVEILVANRQWVAQRLAPFAGGWQTAPPPGGGHR